MSSLSDVGTTMEQSLLFTFFSLVPKSGKRISVLNCCRGEGSKDSVVSAGIRKYLRIRQSYGGLPGAKKACLALVANPA